MIQGETMIQQPQQVMSQESKIEEASNNMLIRGKTIAELRAAYDWDVYDLKPVKKFEDEKGEKFIYRLDYENDFVDLVQKGKNDVVTLNFTDNKAAPPDVIGKQRADQIYNFVKEHTRNLGLHPIGELARSKKDKTYDGKDIEYRTYVTKEKNKAYKMTYYEFLLDGKVIKIVTSDDETRYTDIWQKLKDGYTHFMPNKRKVSFESAYGVPSLDSDS